MQGLPDHTDIEPGDGVGTGGRGDFGLGLRGSFQRLRSLAHRRRRRGGPGRERLLQRLLDPDEFPLRIAEPVGAPDAVDLPAEPLEHLLSQTVAVPRGAGAVIAGPVALDAQQIATPLPRIHHRQIDEEPGRSDLVSDIVSPRPQPVGDRLLER